MPLNLFRRKTAICPLLRRPKPDLHRNHYLVVGLAPFVIITLAAIILTMLAPSLASYILFATIGNISGAAGDIWSAARLLRMPRITLIEDTDSGYRAWQIGV